MIKFNNVSKIYSPETKALDCVSFEIKPKEFVLLVGRSGAGKTTLLRLLLAEERPTEGEIFFDGNNLNDLKHDDLPFLRRKIGAVFQDYKLLNSKTTYENVAYVLEVMGISEEEIKRDVPKVLDLVGLTDKANKFPVQLSGGEKQRAAIARALVHRPEVILADEPTGKLDPYHASDIIRLLLKIQEMGTTVILATHDKEVINNLKRRVISLDKGKIIRDEEEGRFIL